MVLTGMGPQLVLIGALGALVGVTIWLVVAVGSAATPSPPWVTPRSSAGRVALSNQQVSTLRSRIAYGRSTGGDERLYAILVELIDDQLAAAHGVDRTTDPDAARAILGDHLFEFAADPTAARSLTRRRAVERVVAGIEAI